MAKISVLLVTGGHENGNMPFWRCSQGRPGYGVPARPIPRFVSGGRDPIHDEQHGGQARPHPQQSFGVLDAVGPTGASGCRISMKTRGRPWGYRQ